MGGGGGEVLAVTEQGELEKGQPWLLATLDTLQLHLLARNFTFSVLDPVFWSNFNTWNCFLIFSVSEKDAAIFYWSVFQSWYTRITWFLHVWVLQAGTITIIKSHQVVCTHIHVQ